jgi:hypothetical protein
MSGRAELTLEPVHSAASPGSAHPGQTTPPIGTARPPIVTLPAPVPRTAPQEDTELTPIRLAPDPARSDDTDEAVTQPRLIPPRERARRHAAIREEAALKEALREDALPMLPARRWRTALAIGVAMVGTVALLALPALVREPGASTSVVRVALAQAAPSISAAPPPELEPFDTNDASEKLARAARDKARGCGVTRPSVRVSVTFAPSGRAVTTRLMES